MQVAVDEVVVVVGVRHELVPARVVVHVRGVARECAVGVRARDGIGIRRTDCVIVDVPFMNVVHVCVM